MNSWSYFPLLETPNEQPWTKKDDGVHLRSLMLEGLPSNDISNHVETPSPKSGQVYVC